MKLTRKPGQYQQQILGCLEFKVYLVTNPLHQFSVLKLLQTQRELVSLFLYRLFKICIIKQLLNSVFTKQLLDEVEHYIMNYQTSYLCYMSQPSASTA